MNWITPKTNWVEGDWFTHVDYNRIRNNLLYINEFLNVKYPDSAMIISLGETKSYGDNYYPSEFNAFEECLESFKRIGVDLSVGTRSYYYGNKKFINATQLNRLETCCLRWKDINPPVSSISIEPSEFKISEGDTQQLTLTVEPNDSVYTVSWASSNTSVMTVDSNGLVTAVSGGSAVITATVHQAGYSDKTATSNGNVRIAFTSIQWSVHSLTLKRNEKTTVYLNIEPTNADIDELVYGSAELLGWISNIKSTATAGRYQVTVTAMEDEIDAQMRNGSVSFENMEMKNSLISIPAESVKDNIIDYITITTPPMGTIYPYNGNEELKTIAYFKTLGHGIDGSNISTVQIVASHEYMFGGYHSVKESGAQWRTQVQNFITAYFTSTINSALKSVKKKSINSYAGLTPSITSYSSRYHLPSVDEVFPYPEALYDCPLLANGYYETGSVDTLSRTMVRTINDSSNSKHITMVEGHSMREGVKVTNDSSEDKSEYDLAPLFFLNSSVKVKEYKYLNTETDYYFDWSGKSDITIKDIPLGSRIYDIGMR